MLMTVGGWWVMTRMVNEAQVLSPEPTASTNETIGPDTSKEYYDKDGYLIKPDGSKVAKDGTVAMTVPSLMEREGATIDKPAKSRDGKWTVSLSRKQIGPGRHITELCLTNEYGIEFIYDANGNRFAIDTESAMFTPDSKYLLYNAQGEKFRYRFGKIYLDSMKVTEIMLPNGPFDIGLFIEDINSVLSAGTPNSRGNYMMQYIDLTTMEVHNIQFEATDIIINSLTQYSQYPRIVNNHIEDIGENPTNQPGFMIYRAKLPLEYTR